MHVKQMQKFLRRIHYYGIEKSTHDQRIEWSWGCLRKESGPFWMDVFREMANDAGEPLPVFAEVSSTLPWYNSAL